MSITGTKISQLENVDIQAFKNVLEVQQCAEVISGLIYGKATNDGNNTYMYIGVLYGTKLKVSGYPSILTPTPGEHLISTIPLVGGHGATRVWIDSSGVFYGSSSAGWGGIPAWPEGNFYYIGETTNYEYSHMFLLNPFIPSDLVFHWSSDIRLWSLNPGTKQVYDISEFGALAIDAYVSGYNYKGRSNTSTVPEETHLNWYFARLEAGTSTFTNFINSGNSYSITVATTTMVALKYTTDTWSHTVLPFTSMGGYSRTFSSKDLTVGSGTYLIDIIPIFKSITGYGSVFINAAAQADILDSGFWSIYKNLTFHGFVFNDYYRPSPLEFHDCNIYVDDSIASGNRYLIILGFNNQSIYYNHKFINTNFYYTTLYTCIYGSLIDHIDIINCKFIGTTISHPIRINNLIGGAEIAYNYIDGGITGIFFGSQRYAPIENIDVHDNEICNQTEEGISFDGFGNNWDLCPVICNGLITAVGNNIDGRLVISADLKERDASSEIESPISGRTTWTNYYFVFSDGSGLDGLICKIYDYGETISGSTDSLTIDSFINASQVTLGGLVGVHVGFFNCKVRNNYVHGVRGQNNTYGTGLSIYLNVFNFEISGNVIDGCAYGMNLAGGQMLTTYWTLAYNNIVRDNRFYNTIYDAVWFSSYWGGVNAKKQFGNQFINNIVYKSGIKMNKQFKFIFENNQLDQCTFDWEYMQDTLPTADATYLGRTFLVFTNDGNGDPTDIKEYRCKLVTSSWSWVEIA
jgi:hypothetical protein